jgi:hypothetical protein
VGTTVDKPTVDGKAGAAAQKDNRDTRSFIETHQVTKVARKAVPGSGEESADLLQDEEAGRSKSGS